MTSRQTATVKTYVKIDVSPKGITLFIEGLDSDLASLIASAETLHVLAPEYHTFDTSDVTIKTDKILAFVDPPVPGGTEPTPSEPSEPPIVSP